MANHDADSSSRLLFTLKADNRDRWFDAVTDIAKAAGRYYTIEESLNSYCRVKDIHKEGIDWESIPDDEDFVIDKAKRKEYDKDNAWLGLRIKANLSETDRVLIEDLEYNKDRIATLRKKYYKVSATAGNSVIKQLTHWTMNEALSIEDNWAQIHGARRAAHQYSSETKFDDKMLYSFFIQGLPADFATTIQSLNAQASLSIQEKVDVLGEQYAMFAPKKGKKIGAAFISEEQEDTYAARDELICYICDDPDHFARQCPYKSKAYEYAKRLRAEDKRHGKTLDREPKPYRSRRRDSSSSDRSARSERNTRLSTPRNNNSKTSKTRFPGRSASRDRYVRFAKHVDKNEVMKALLAAGLIADQDSGSDQMSDGDDSSDEQAHVSNEHRKVPASKWISDTGCTSHMTDKSELFRGPLSPKRVPIRVGGGSALVRVNRYSGSCIRRKWRIYLLGKRVAGTHFGSQSDVSKEAVHKQGCHRTIHSAKDDVPQERSALH